MESKSIKFNNLHHYFTTVSLNLMALVRWPAPRQKTGPGTGLPRSNEKGIPIGFSFSYRTTSTNRLYDINDITPMR